MAKPEWGTKRICPSCGTRYYDLLRDPVICPKCATPFDPEAFLRVAPRPPRAAGREGAGAGRRRRNRCRGRNRGGGSRRGGRRGGALEEAEEEEDEELIEDASELGEDEDDMAEVIENVEEEEH